MSIIVGDTLKREEIPLFPDKIRQYEISPNKLEVSLTEWWGCVSAGISLGEFSDRVYDLKSWENREIALEEFPALVDKFKKGEYILRIYSNGEVKVEFQ